MAKSQQTFNKLEKEKKRKKKKEDKRKKMLARKEAKESGDLVTNEFVYVDYNGNFTDTPPDPAEREKINAKSIAIPVKTPKYIVGIKLDRTNIEKPNTMVIDVFKIAIPTVL